VLKFVEGFTNETNVTVWRDLISNLLKMAHVLLNTDFQPEFQAFIVRLLKPIAGKLGWDAVEGESGLQGMCRGTILRTLGINGDADTIAEAKKRFAAHLAGDLIPADIRSAVYASVLFDADETVLQQFIDLHNKESLQEEKMRLCTSLGAVKKPELIQKVLEFALSPSVRSQDSVTVIINVSNNTSTKLSSDLTWKFVKDQWEVIHARYSTGFLITRLVKTCCENFATKADFDDVTQFFKAHPVPGAKRSIEQALESIQVNTACLGRDCENLKKFLKA